ncbi:SDR family oxidoreductase [Xanthomonas euvesicatoria]|uniref:SDR family oxidoreductase n=1 Tax=Xanthomonas euvesicatoria TaxID=456327 RepID=UPI001C48ED02|nr:SDR family oxidoreductase [Xanthomonas euvesicatoria]
MVVGISGASGKLGRAVVAELEKRSTDSRLVGITRTPQALESGIETRLGDYDRPETLITAYKGLDRLLLIPSADLRPGVRGRQLTAAIDAAVRAGIAHIFLLSASGTREVSEASLNSGYWIGEQHLIKTAPRWTILRMNYYAESMLEEVLASVGQGVLAGLGEERVAYVSRNDLAAAAAGALLSEGHVGALYIITGPAIVTGPERAAIASDVLGKPLAFAVVSEDQLRAGLSQAGLPTDLVEVVAEIKSTFVKGYFDVVTGDAQRLSGRAPKSFRDVFTSFQA